jgi:threonine aldolase
VVSVENTHNMGGGLCWTRDALDGVIAVSRGLGMALHLDGARLWNAAVAQGVTERSLAAGFDTVSVCLSKGLGAPAGSLVCTTRERIGWCRRLRKMFGGGMRQVGILAAAGLYAVEHNRARLAEDHANARTLAQALGVDPARVETNIVMMEVAHPPRVVEAAARRGVKIGTAPGGRVRMVTHLDVDRSRCIDAANIIRECLA